MHNPPPSSSPSPSVNPFSVILLLTGIVLVSLALAAESLGLDITPGFGILQVVLLLLGLTGLTLAGYLQVYTLRKNVAARSLQADIGVRLGATGLVFAYVVGLSDLLGIGTHITPRFERPFVGPIQLGGIGVGVILIIVGLLLYYTSRGSREASALNFLINNETENREPAQQQETS